MELGTWQSLGEQTPRDQQHLTAKYKTWFLSQPGRVGSRRGGEAPGHRENPGKSWTAPAAGKQAREEMLQRVAGLAALVGCRLGLASAPRCVEREKGLLRTAQLSACSREEEKAAWGGGS